MQIHENNAKKINNKENIEKRIVSQLLNDDYFSKQFCSICPIRSTLGI